MTYHQIATLDYVVLGLILSVSVLIGFYHGYQTRIHNFFSKNRVNNQLELTDINEANTRTSEYLTANSTMGTIPVAFSLLASFYSASSLLGVPAEMYQYGAQFWLSCVSQASSPILGAYVTGPFFARLKIKSLFEYFEMRFESKNVRLVGTICYFVRNSIACAIFMYGPATSLALLANMDEKICICILGLIGTVYTTVGGIRGVIWNDFFQALVMFTSLIMISIKAVYDANGFSNVWEIARQGNRLNILNFDPNPFIRQTFWSIIIGQAFYSSQPYCFDQQMIQRFQASRTKQVAKRALLLNCPGILVLVSLCCFVGLGIYSNYAGCDPLTHPDPSSRISNPNQLVGYFILNNMHEIPGAGGIFLASLFCGSLSSVSSFLNSQAAILWHDVFQSFEPFRSFDDSKSLTTNKIIVLFCGLLGTGLAFVIATIPGNLIQIGNTLNGALSAPLTGLFLLGMLFSVSTQRGVIMGTSAGFLMGLWLAVGNYIVKPRYPTLDFSTVSCTNESYLQVSQLVQNYTMASELKGVKKFFSLSYQWYMPLGTLLTIIVGIFVSICDRFRGNDKILGKPEFIFFDLTPSLYKKSIDHF